jgi:hypothetical protein
MATAPEAGRTAIQEASRHIPHYQRHSRRHQQSRSSRKGQGSRLSLTRNLITDLPHRRTARSQSNPCDSEEALIGITPWGHEWMSARTNLQRSRQRMACSATTSPINDPESAVCALPPFSLSIGNAAPYLRPIGCSRIAVADRRLLFRALIRPLATMSASEVVKFLSQIREREHVLRIV